MKDEMIKELGKSTMDKLDKELEVNSSLQNVSNCVIHPYSYSESDYWGKWFDCPKCDIDYIPEEANYCPNCGSKISWESDC